MSRKIYRNVQRWILRLRCGHEIHHDSSHDPSHLVGQDAVCLECPMEGVHYPITEVVEVIRET